MIHEKARWELEEKWLASDWSAWNQNVKDHRTGRAKGVFLSKPTRSSVDKSCPKTKKGVVEAAIEEMLMIGDLNKKC